MLYYSKIGRKKVVHLEGCRHTSNISEENRGSFININDAIKAGYRLWVLQRRPRLLCRSYSVCRSLCIYYVSRRNNSITETARADHLVSPQNLSRRRQRKGRQSNLSPYCLQNRVESG